MHYSLLNSIMQHDVTTYCRHLRGIRDTCKLMIVTHSAWREGTGVCGLIIHFGREKGREEVYTQTLNPLPLDVVIDTFKYLLSTTIKQRPLSAL